ncbi:hypothetical protein HRW16_11780 [Streptomyces lunaelactis]|nr:hypothetical protein [Streptomyces lunaelactis]NUK16748.1 hypothetical protein [Streptomyces lunaelactis]NUK35747.1 hypothetical protein [Streptomyces lunaelactis]NUK41361.1 hypothetical protein [Streptomyces lunaelactis]NUK92516.1 hypothetical protein [Streptomyces lunaelactis]
MRSHQAASRTRSWPTASRPAPCARPALLDDRDQHGCCRGVQQRGHLVTDQPARPQHQRPGRAGALRLPVADLVRAAAGEFADDDTARVRPVRQHSHPREGGLAAA